MEPLTAEAGAPATTGRPGVHGAIAAGVAPGIGEGSVMGDAVGQVLAPAVGIAISPLPIIAVVLLLATPRPVANGLAFAAGWIVALTVVVTIAIVLGGQASGDGDPASWVTWLKLGIGILFLLLAGKQWHDRPRADRPASQPTWMRAIDRFTPAASAGLAAALAAANPKNLALAVSGAVVIANTAASTSGKTVAAVLLVLIGSLTILLPICVYLFGGSRSAAILAEWRTWLAEHNNAIMTVVLVVLGAKYVGEALTGITV